MRRKRCHCCRNLYQPDPRTCRQQKTCSKEPCRAFRILLKWKNWSVRNPLYHRSRKIKQKQWRAKDPGYWRKWRKAHPGYVKRNRKAQELRNARNRGLIAKPTEIKAVCIDKLDRIRALQFIAKPTESEELLSHKIDGVCRYLKMRLLIAKPTDIAKLGS